MPQFMPQFTSWTTALFDNPLNLLPERQADSTLMLISREALVVFHWANGSFEEQDRFSQNGDGHSRFKAFLAKAGRTHPVFVLVDVIEEEMKGEVIPRLRGMDRNRLLNRRLERLFAATPYRRAVSQGKGKEGEQILFSGLVNPGLITPWLAELKEMKAWVVGLWSQQLLMRQLLRQIDRGSERTLLAVLNSFGLRQTYFVRGRTKISRMSPISQFTGGDQAGKLFEELVRTQRYLSSLRVLDRGQSFDLFYLDSGRSSEGVTPLAASLEGARFTAVDVEVLARKLGIQEGWQAGGLELLTAQLLLRQPPKSHYGNLDEFRGKPLGIKRFLNLWHRWRGDESPQAVKEMAITNGVKPGRRLGDILLERGLITQDQLQTALAEQRRSSETLGRIVVALGLVAETVMRNVLAEALNHEAVDLVEIVPQAEALAMVPKAFAQRHGICPILYDPIKKRMVVAMSNPMNVSVLDLLQARLEEGATLSPRLAGEADVATAIDHYYGHELSVEGILRELETGEMDMDSWTDSTEEFSHPMVRLLNAVLSDAVKREASDIHIGPTAGFVRVRYRIDGVLRLIHSFHKHLLGSLMVRIKVMGGMNMAESRIPQDGTINFDVNGQKVSFRVSIQPTIHGENAVLRILDLRREIRSMAELGLTQHNLEELHRALHRNMGLVLVTGPTGSGKTTTLYSMINHVNNVGINVMTLEDPVEYPMGTVLQTSVNNAVGLDYATGIRSLLWQDPDVILVGEIHDSETANMALQAAMTGHQVMTTLHANSTLGAIPRLINLGTHKDSIIGNINCIIAQRLVRRLCPLCRRPSRATDVECSILGLEGGNENPIYRAVGCEGCFGSGYRGRLPVMEVLRVDETFDELIYTGAPRKEFMAHGQTLGLRTMAMDGIERVKNGQTTLDELVRVVDLMEVGDRVLELNHA